MEWREREGGREGGRSVTSTSTTTGRPGMAPVTRHPSSSLIVERTDLEWKADDEASGGYALRDLNLNLNPWLSSGRAIPLPQCLPGMEA